MAHTGDDIDQALADDGKLTAPICNNCGSSNHAVLYDAGRAQINRIVKCLDCHLMFAHPLAQENLASYTVSLAEDLVPLNESSPEVRRGLNKLPDYEKIGDVLQQYLPNKGRLVEVGAYAGVLLNSLKVRGWRVTGIEPDGRAVEYARRRFEIDMRHGTLENSGLAAGDTDALIMLHVIEHIDDPAAAVGEVQRLLRPGGVFVVETPTYDSLAYRLLGRRERSLSCNGHIFFYTEATLTRLLNTRGFNVFRTERVGRTMSLARLLWNIGVMSKNRFLQGKLLSISERFALEKRYLYLNARDMVRMYAMKV